MHVVVDGTRLWFDVDGPALVPDGDHMRERPTVLLLHGGPGSYDHSYFKPDFGQLARDAQVVYLDLRGHGRSDWGDAEEWSFEACADDVRAFCDVLGIERPVVFGHSLGGYVAMVYAARHPDHPSALVLQSTNGRFDLARLVEGIRRAGGDDVAEIAGRAYGGGAPVTADEWARVFVLFGPNVPSEEEQARKIVNPGLRDPGFALMTSFDRLAELAEIACPTLVCVGELDPVTPVTASVEIVDAMTPGRARLAVVEGAGHFPWKDAPETYWTILTEFVRTVEA